MVPTEHRGRGAGESGDVGHAGRVSQPVSGPRNCSPMECLGGPTGKKAVSTVHFRWFLVPVK